MEILSQLLRDRIGGKIFPIFWSNICNQRINRLGTSICEVDAILESLI